MLTIKNIGLNLLARVAKLIESVGRPTSKNMVLNGCDDIDEHVILKHEKLYKKQQLQKAMICMRN